MLDAMRAAGEAADSSFLLVIDALNEAAEARGWQAELPALLAETSDDPWIAVAVSGSLAMDVGEVRVVAAA
jgi:hypothetical protein